MIMKAFVLGVFPDGIWCGAVRAVCLERIVFKWMLMMCLIGLVLLLQNRIVIGKFCRNLFNTSKYLDD